MDVVEPSARTTMRPGDHAGVYGAVFLAWPGRQDEVPERLAALAAHLQGVAPHLRERLAVDRVVAPPGRSWALLARCGPFDELPAWVAATPGEAAPLDDLLRDLSVVFRQVVVLYQRDDVRVEFERWADGALARRLVWADGVWIRAQGAAEAWEALAFPDGPPSVGARAPAASAAALRAAERAYGLWYAWDAQVPAADAHVLPPDGAPEADPDRPASAAGPGPGTPPARVAPGPPPLAPAPGPSEAVAKTEL